MAFANQFDWGAALADISTAGERPIPFPSANDAPSIQFYKDLCRIMQRVGIKYLWVDQLSIPQKRDATTCMNIVHASGSLYRQFEVLYWVIWVPWILLDDSELEEQRRKADAGSGPNQPILNAYVQDMVRLYAQFQRGWILREAGEMCKQLASEAARNATHISEMNRVLVDYTDKKRAEHEELGQVSPRSLSRCL